MKNPFNPFLCHVILFGWVFFKMILSPESRKLFDTTEGKKKKKTFISYLQQEIRNFLV